MIVKVNERKYKVYITSLVRLQQDFETEMQESGYYLSEANMIIVNDTTKTEIERTIKKLHKSGYFEKLDNYGF